MTANAHQRNTVRRIECEEDGLYFTRYFMKQRTGAKMVIGQHHPVVQHTLDRVMAGEISRLIVTVPPGYTKTEQVLINFSARGIALDPRTRFMHLSYSEKLALLSSSTTRSIVLSDEFQTMWPTRIRLDTKAKSMWYTPTGGGVYATTINGQPTGFRAGTMDKTRFTGALLIDDPLKPADALSKLKRNEVNDNYGNVIASRLAVETVPVILIMQRIHYDDLAGFLLRGGSGEDWYHLDLPVILGLEPEYPKESTHGIPIEHGLPDGWLWPYKHDASNEKALKAHKRKWKAQYMQRPPKIDSEKALWKEKEIDAARSRKRPWKKKRTVVGVDPATTNNANSDMHGIVAASAYTDGDYSVDKDRSLNGSPAEWAYAAIKLFYEVDADAIIVETNQGGDMCVTTLRNCKYKGKKFKGRIIRIHASKSKFARAEPIEALYEMGEVYHDNDADLVELETELLEYNPEDAKESPNRLDAMVWALTELSGISAGAAVW